MKAGRYLMPVLAALLALELSGCATTGFMGLATKRYVDDRFEATGEDLGVLERDLELAYEDYEENRERLKALETEVARLIETKRELEALVEIIRRNEQATEELRAIADEAERRLAELPDETLLRLAELIMEELAVQEE